MESEAHKLPSRLSGGQQQRAAIARSLANDPPIIATDEPTGNLDSRTAETVLSLFETLVDQGKTVLMVTHDPDLARRAPRTITLASGELLDEHLTMALPTLTHDLLLEATHQLERCNFAAGEAIIRPESEPDKFYVVTSGDVDVYLPHPKGDEILLDSLGPGQFFGEIALIRGGLRSAIVKASHAGPVEVISLGKDTFLKLIHSSQDTLNAVMNIMMQRTERQKMAGQQS
jgi:energy-coupling factor transporter ATP-binding protein EcfA2